MTPNSAATAFVAADDALTFVDARLVGDLVGDIGVRVAADSLPTNTVWQAFLDAAAGEIESAALAGGRYEPADLTTLASITAPATKPPVGGIRLQSLNAWLAVGFLHQRRQFVAPRPEAVKYAQEMLEQLRKGERIFGFVETQRAGQPALIDNAAPTTRPQLSRRDRRYFGFRDKYRTTGCWGGCD